MYGTCGQVVRKKCEKNIFFCILKINEERSRIRSWIRIRIRNWILIRFKMSRIPNTALRGWKGGDCFCPLSWSVHCNFVRDVNRLKGGGRAPPTLTSQGWFFHHDGMYAKNRQSPLCVYSVDLGTTSTKKVIKEQPPARNLSAVVRRLIQTLKSWKPEATVLVKNLAG